MIMAYMTLTVVVAGSSMTLYIRWFALATLVAGSLSASVRARVNALHT